ncbi:MULTISPECIES: SHOCT domain-containing protein [Kosakonia]|nr:MULTISPECIES: SHOCT domain-containing protein [Kosakonia]
MDKIERLAEMKEEGILTEEEFQQQKQRILNP